MLGLIGAGLGLGALREVGAKGLLKGTWGATKGTYSAYKFAKSRAPGITNAVMAGAIGFAGYSAFQAASPAYEQWYTSKYGEDEETRAKLERRKNAVGIAAFAGPAALFVGGLGLSVGADMAIGASKFVGRGLYNAGSNIGSALTGPKFTAWASKLGNLPPHNVNSPRFVGPKMPDWHHLKIGTPKNVVKSNPFSGWDSFAASAGSATDSVLNADYAGMMSRGVEWGSKLIPSSNKIALGIGAAAGLGNASYSMQQRTDYRLAGEGTITSMSSNLRGGISPELQFSTQGLSLGIHNNRKKRTI